MNADSLGGFMGNAQGVNYGAWAVALRAALVKYDISTPQRVGALLAQAKNETGGLKKVVEQDNDFTIANLLNPALFGSRFTASSGHIVDGRMLDWAHYLGRVDSKAPLVSQDFARQVANIAYNGKNGNIVGTDDGWNFRGRGPFHLTGRTNYEAFARDIYGLGSAGYNQIMNNPGVMDFDIDLLALSAAWYWARYPNQSSVILNSLADGLPELNTIAQVNFDPISSVIATDRPSFGRRLTSYSVEIMPKVLVGGNPMENIQLALAKLGFHSVGVAGGTGKFGITLHTPSPLAIRSSSANNLSSTGDVTTIATNGADFIGALLGAENYDLKATIDDALTGLNFQGNGVDMIWLNNVDEGDLQQKSVMVVSGGVSSSIMAASKQTVAVCDVINNKPLKDAAGIPVSGGQRFSARYAAGDYFRVWNPAKGLSPGNILPASFEVMQPPLHGKLNQDFHQNEFEGDYVYTPNLNFFGKDSFVVKITFGSEVVEVRYFMNMVSKAIVPVWDKYCPDGSIYKISSATWIDLSDSSDMSNQVGAASLTQILSGLSSMSLTFAPLSGWEVGATDQDERITLSPSAAGHGWYLDPTPRTNTDDFLPTADPTVWRAKLGSAADGKMDMLSVLLHEYGHVLGLEHSGDGHDFMGATLQPGERRLPTASELAWMAQRVAELKAGQDGSLPADPAQPDPSHPAYPAWGTANTATRQSRRSSTSTGTANASVAPPQSATAVNATLTNGTFTQSGAPSDSPSGYAWTTQGDVRFTADGAVLGEAGGTQARLLQGFAVGANDKFLSFTIAGTGLAANAAGPGDAFEVALLDADAGESVVGHVALNGSDALLNRQITGFERLAATVRKTANADGSTTYLVTLAPELAGRSVLLSFDLLGFAVATSSVTVRDVALLVEEPVAGNHAPTAVDGTVTGLEDTALILRWSDFHIADVDGTPLRVAISALPANGVLQRQQADGAWAAAALDERFSEAELTARGLRFVPANNASGDAYARIGFKAFDGELFSAQANLLVAITAVADAPLLSLSARDVSVSRELLATSFESVANANTAATVVSGTTLEGWTATPIAAGKAAAFEVWASGDRMANDIGNAATVQAGDGNGRQWIALRNGSRTSAYQSLGLERSIDTLSGAVYTLTFDYAGALGLPASNTLIGIYVDGARIATYAATSSRTALNWQALSFQFNGNGQQRRVSLVLEGGTAYATTTATQRGAMIDDIRLVETLPNGVATVYGLSGTDIALPQVLASLSDSFGSERLTLALLGVPVGAVVSDGTHSATVGAAGDAVDLTGWNLTRLSLHPLAGFTGDIALQVRATSRETSNGASASVSQALTVKVLAGTSVATPVGVNPFVTQAEAAGSSAVTPLAISKVTPLDERGSAPAAALFTGRTAEEEADAAIARSHALTDAWLKALEERAKAQWLALVGGR